MGERREEGANCRVWMAEWPNGPRTGVDNPGFAGREYRCYECKTRNISLPSELDALVGDRVRSGLYGDASEVVRAGLRALAREEIGVSLRRFDEIMAALPDGPPLAPEIEQDV